MQHLVYKPSTNIRFKKNHTHFSLRMQMWGANEARCRRYGARWIYFSPPIKWTSFRSNGSFLLSCKWESDFARGTLSVRFFWRLLHGSIASHKHNFSLIYWEIKPEKRHLISCSQMCESPAPNRQPCLFRWIQICQRRNRKRCDKKMKQLPWVT